MAKQLQANNSSARKWFLIGALLAFAWPAQAHDWFTGQKNDKGESCCNNADCRILPDGAAFAVRGGYVIMWLPADISAGQKLTFPIYVPNTKAKPGEDPYHYAACVWANEVKCFFTPSPGF